MFLASTGEDGYIGFAEPQIRVQNFDWTHVQRTPFVDVDVTPELEADQGPLSATQGSQRIVKRNMFSGHAMN